MTQLLRIILLFVLLTLVCDASAQSIADVARQERDRKKATANKTYTNADIGKAAVTGSVAPAVTSPAGVAATGTATAKSSGPTDNKGHDEKYWRDQFSSAREDLKNAEDQIRILEARADTSNRRMLGQSDLYNRDGRLQAEIAAFNTQIAQVRLEADKTRKKIILLEDELRRSGGPPGWAR